MFSFLFRWGVGRGSSDMASWVLRMKVSMFLYVIVGEVQ